LLLHGLSKPTTSDPISRAALRQRALTDGPTDALKHRGRVDALATCALLGLEEFTQSVKAEATLHAGTCRTLSTPTKHGLLIS
jgi:hypothetical protein